MSSLFTELLHGISVAFSDFQDAFPDFFLVDIHVLTLPSISYDNSITRYKEKRKDIFLYNGFSIALIHSMFTIRSKKMPFLHVDILIYPAYDECKEISNEIE